MNNTMFSTTTSAPPPANERAVRLRGSCIQCRKRKRKCDKLRPSCSLCLHSNTPCAYDTFQAYDSNAPKKRRKRKTQDKPGPEPEQEPDHEPPEPDHQPQPTHISQVPQLVSTGQRQPPGFPVPQAASLSTYNPNYSTQHTNFVQQPAFHDNPANILAVGALLSKTLPRPDLLRMFPNQDYMRNATDGHSSRQITPLDDDNNQALSINHSSSSSDSSSSSSSSPSSSGTGGSVTAVSHRYPSTPPKFQLDSFYSPNTSAPFKYLWSFYVENTARFCAIHDFETPFVSSVVPMACNNPALQYSLMYLSSIYRNRILGMADPNHEAIATELSLRTMRGLRDHLSLNLTPSEALVGITACLGLTCCFIGENSSENYNTHLYGGLMIATQVVVPNRTLHLSLEAWFVMKWLTYAQVLVNINLLSLPERLVQAKAQNLGAMLKLYDWWQLHAPEDPEYNLPVDSFYGFGTRLAPMILQLNILATRDGMVSLGLPNVQPANEHEINALESALTLAHETSIMAKYSAVCLRQTDIDLLHCDASFHGAALLYLYTYLKTDEFSQNELIPHLVLSVISEVKAISPVCRTAAALLFVMYITGSYSTGDQRKFIYSHLDSMRQTCLSSVGSVLKGLELIWRLRDSTDLTMRACHRKVAEAGINVCVY